MLMVLIATAIFIFFGFPIYISLLGGSVFYFLIHPELSMIIFIQKILNAPNSSKNYFTSH